LLSVPTRERRASVLTRVEIEGGMRTPETASVAELLGALILLPVSDAIARRAGEHLRRYRRWHRGIDLVDSVIAATAEGHDAPHATLNVEHLPMFVGSNRAFG
jgi:predicted nucleic acid-binding protein